MAHAEASAKTVEAAVAAAAAQLGLRSDQVDVEVLEEPVPSTFGFIGSPARVRVTARSTSGPVEAPNGAAGPASSDVPSSSDVPHRPASASDQPSATSLPSTVESPRSPTRPAPSSPSGPDTALGVTRTLAGEPM